MSKFNDIHGLFKYVKKQNFMFDYSDIKPTAGFNHRFSGQLIGDKVAELTDEDNHVVAIALDGFIEDCQRLRDDLLPKKLI